MLRRFLFGVGIGALALALLVGGRQFVWPQAEPPPTGAACPFTLSGAGPAERHEAAGWEIFVSDPEGDGPQVEAKAGSYDMAGRDVPACVLEVVRPPSAPYREVDWRIGYRVPLDGERHGQPVRFTASLAAEPAMTFGAASLYINDHAALSHAAILELTEIAKPFSIDADPSPSTNEIEVWFRLTIHAPISTAGKIYLVDPRLEFAP